MTGDMVIGYGINNNGYVVDVLPDTFPGNIITAVTSWVKKVDICNNVSTKISVKWDVDGLLSQNIPLKDVNKVDILNTTYTNPHKK